MALAIKAAPITHIRPPRPIMTVMGNFCNWGGSRTAVIGAYRPIGARAKGWNVSAPPNCAAGSHIADAQLPGDGVAVPSPSPRRGAWPVAGGSPRCRATGKEERRSSSGWHLRQMRLSCPWWSVRRARRFARLPWQCGPLQDALRRGGPASLIHCARHRAHYAGATALATHFVLGKRRSARRSLPVNATKIVTDLHKWSSKAPVFAPGKPARTVAPPLYSLLDKAPSPARDLQTASNAS
jgi:hypothetical protein